MLIPEHVMRTFIGASGDVVTSNPPEPMCIVTIVSVSSHAAQNGSQWSVWSDGSPSACGFIEKLTQCEPFAAVRWISSAMSCGCRIGGIEHGMNRSGYAPHQAPMCQSLYARTTAR